jgi:hypothetical protein
MDIEAIKRSIAGGSQEFRVQVVQFLLDEIEKYKKANVVELQSWKGVSGYEIHSGPMFYRVVEYRKDKQTGEVKDSYTDVPKENVEFMRELLKRFPVKTKYRQVVTELIKAKNLPCGIDAFNGGTNRASYYFPLYYYPIKILEWKKEVEYGGGGTITKLK